MNPIERAIRKVDATQRRFTPTAFVYGVVKKYGDDNGGVLVSNLAYSAFVSMFPLLLVLVTIVRPNIGVMILVLGLTAWLVPARLVRGEALTLRVREYVQAVRVMGGTSWRSVSRHIIPNVAGTVIVNATFQVADAILLIAYLGYLGLGLPAPTTDWGGMLSNGTQFVFLNYWWLIYPPGIAIILVVIAVNFVGDGLRDAVEVRLQRR